MWVPVLADLQLGSRDGWLLQWLLESVCAAVTEFLSMAVYKDRA